MPVITPFGDLRLGDETGLQMWIQAHNRRHKEYVKKGLGPPGGTFAGPVDGDWMFRHVARHVALATIAKYPMSSADTKALSLPHEWQTDEELQEWHAMHNRLHSLIDHIQTIAQSTPAPPGSPPGTGSIVRPGHPGTPIP